MKIGKHMRSIVVCDCGEFDGWHISIGNKCYPPGMSEDDASKIAQWLILNDVVETKEWPIK